MCLQIGANDGTTSDPLHELFRSEGWHGLLVEPQPDVFEHGLKVAYANNDRVWLANVAIGPAEGTLPLYRIAFSRAEWASGLSSFSRDHIQAHIDRGYVTAQAARTGVSVPTEPHLQIEVVHVKVMTLEGLLANHSVKAVDLICIDTEGFDLEILKLVDFAAIDPEVILFESQNLTDADYQEALQLLAAQGFTLRWSFGDTLAYKVAYSRGAEFMDAVKDSPGRGRRKVARIWASLSRGSAAA